MNTNKAPVLSVFFLLINCFVFSQELKYYSIDEKEVTKEDCYFYTKKEKTVWKRADTIKSYFCKNNKPKSLFYYLNGKREGYSYDYYSNGALEQKTTHRQGNPTIKEIYYPSGSIRANFAYDTSNVEFGQDYLIVDTWDSLGIQGVKNKNGFCHSLYTFFGEEIGFVKNGLKDSIWLTFDSQTKAKLYEDWYRLGKFLRGKSYLNDEVIEYKEVIVSATPKGGMKSFYKELSSNLRYPKEARKARVQGKVFIQFIIDSNGSIQDAKCIKGIGKGCDEAALEAVKRGKLWIPSLQKGIPIKQRFTVPIDFKL